MPIMCRPRGLSGTPDVSDIAGVMGPFGATAEIPRGLHWVTQALTKPGLSPQIQELMKYLPLAPGEGIAKRAPRAIAEALVPLLDRLKLFK